VNGRTIAKFIHRGRWPATGCPGSTIDRPRAFDSQDLEVLYLLGRVRSRGAFWQVAPNVREEPVGCDAQLRSCVSVADWNRLGILVACASLSNVIRTLIVVRWPDALTPSRARPPAFIATSNVAYW
jgi:hypothetical protein